MGRAVSLLGQGCDGLRRSLIICNTSVDRLQHRTRLAHREDVPVMIASVEDPEPHHAAEGLATEHVPPWRLVQGQPSVRDLLPVVAACTRRAWPVSSFARTAQ